MFPGQGSQEVSMGQSLFRENAEIKALYQHANEIVGYDLAGLCFEGPIEKLNSTVVSQPAIFVTSVACLKALRSGMIADDLKDVMPDACAGLSLGEYTALYAASAMSFADALKLVQLRGESMQEAAELRSGTMVSILGLDEEGVNKLCQAALADAQKEPDGQEAVLSAVNFNCPGQIVISGTVNACKRAEELACEYGAGRAIVLRVAGGFHTSLMDPAATKLRKALDHCQFSDPACQVVANIDARVYDGADEIAEKLMRQLVGPIRWQESVEWFIEKGVERFVEIGPGRVLTGLVKKISRAKKQKVEIITVN